MRAEVEVTQKRRHSCGVRKRETRGTQMTKRQTLTGRKRAQSKSECWQGKRSLRLTEGFGQQVLDELCVIADVQHAVDTGVHQLLLVVAQVLGHVLGHKHNVTLHVHHKEEAIQGLRGEGGGRREFTSLFTPVFTLIQMKSLRVKWKQKEDIKNMSTFTSHLHTLLIHLRL